MPRITPVDYATAQGRPKELLDAAKIALGATPNMTTTMARSAVLDGWLSLSRALRKGSISAADGERIALGVAEAVVRTHGGVSENDIRAARDAGLSDAELGDVVGHVAINVLTNYFNRAFDVDVDFPVVEPHNDPLAA